MTPTAPLPILYEVTTVLLGVGLLLSAMAAVLSRAARVFEAATTLLGAWRRLRRQVRAER